MQNSWPTTGIVDREREFLAEFAEIIQKVFLVTKKVITTWNLQENSMIEHEHKIIRNKVHPFELKN